MKFPVIGSIVLFSLYLAFKFLPKEVVNAILSGGCWDGTVARGVLWLLHVGGCAPRQPTQPGMRKTLLYSLSRLRSQRVCKLALAEHLVAAACSNRKAVLSQGLGVIPCAFGSRPLLPCSLLCAAGHAGPGGLH
jgi:hypothetical protein